ncbi:MAG: thioredoxin domain-containing protein [Nanoarchaeota archaeon]|nr:thioredoxin domain-containing protein [DPANN group archaeon]MBL7116246.1 thioredoxin domain-containing protein [Nanoarchaeota archaeon]
MICVIALVVFGVMGVFSVKHRIIAKEALDCVLRRVTLRKCETGLDKRLKAQITGKLMKRHPMTGKQIYKHFELISWIFTILLVASIFYSSQGIYQFVVYGNCNGEDSTGFCPFNPEATGDRGHSDFRDKTALKPEVVTTDDDPWFGNPEAKVTIVEFGCYKCPYTKEAAFNVVKKLYEEYQEDVYFVYRDFPLSIHEYAHEPSLSAQCVFEQSREKYWDYYFKLFENQKVLSNEVMRDIVFALGLDIEQYDECFSSEKYSEELDNDYKDGFLAGIYGTPTFFINGKEALVGPRPFKEFKKIIKQELKE